MCVVFNYLLVINISFFNFTLFFSNLYRSSSVLILISSNFFAIGIMFNFTHAFAVLLIARAIHTGVNILNQQLPRNHTFN